MPREFVGQIGTDIASFILIDPCLLNDPKAKLERSTRLEQGIKREEAEGNQDRADNLRRIQKQDRESYNLTSNWKEYCNDLKGELVKPYAGGLIFSTGADGGYNVYVNKNKAGEITKVELEL